MINYFCNIFRYYSKEEGTPAFDMPDHVPDRIKKQRCDTLMKTQKEISRTLQEKSIGKTLEVMIDEKPKEEKDLYLGRTSSDAPEVDGMVYVHSSKVLQPGEFESVKITDAFEYDLTGEI